MRRECLEVMVQDELDYNAVVIVGLWFLLEISSLFLMGSVIPDWGLHTY